MKKSLTINATRAGKKVAKNIGFVNPNVANSLVGSAAQMFNALTNDTFVNSEVVKVMDTSEEEQSTTPAPAGKTEGVIICDGGSFDDPTVTTNSDADCIHCAAADGKEYFTLQSGATPSLSTLVKYYFFTEATANYTAAVNDFFKTD